MNVSDKVNAQSTTLLWYSINIFEIEKSIAVQNPLKNLTNPGSENLIRCGF